MLGYSPKNLRASRQGYDPVTQNPDAFMQNGGKLDVFERASPQDYQVDEQLTVPIGLTLVEEGGQAYVYYSTLIASEQDAQEASRTPPSASRRRFARPAGMSVPAVRSATRTREPRSAG
ncbi:MAG: hypothetical protein R3E65_11795 [Steroidobacteraceae bacterium]